MVEKVADAVKRGDARRRHRRSEGRALRPDQDAAADRSTRCATPRSAASTVACEVHNSMGVSNGTTALGIAVALGEIKMPKAEEICRDLDLYSSVASCSSGVELTQAQIVLLGNKAGAGGRYRIGHAVMRDAIDIDGIYDSIRNAGLELPERPRAEDLKGRVVNCFMKCEADPPASCAAAARSCSTIPTSISSPRQGRRRRRRRRGDRRPRGVRLGRRHAPGPAGRRPVHRHRRCWRVNGTTSENEVRRCEIGCRRPDERPAGEEAMMNTSRNARFAR